MEAGKICACLWGFFQCPLKCMFNGVLRLSALGYATASFRKGSLKPAIAVPSTPYANSFRYSFYTLCTWQQQHPPPVPPQRGVGAERESNDPTHPSCPTSLAAPCTSPRLDTDLVVPPHLLAWTRTARSPLLCPRKGQSERGRWRIERDYEKKIKTIERDKKGRRSPPSRSRKRGGGGI